MKKCVVSLAFGDLAEKMYRLMAKSLQGKFDGDVFKIGGGDASYKDISVFKLQAVLEKLSEYDKVALVDADIIFKKSIDNLFEIDGMIVSQGPTEISRVRRGASRSIIQCLDPIETEKYRGMVTPNAGFFIACKEDIEQIKKWLDYKVKMQSNDEQSALIAMFLRNEIKATMIDVCTYPYLGHSHHDPYFMHFAGSNVKKRPRKIMRNMLACINAS